MKTFSLCLQIRGLWWLAHAPRYQLSDSPTFGKKKIEFIHGRVTKLDPKANTLHLENGSTEHYDYLVIATGPKLNFAAVEGAGPHGGFTHLICTLDHAETCYEDVKTR